MRLPWVRKKKKRREQAYIPWPHLLENIHRRLKPREGVHIVEGRSERKGFDGSMEEPESIVFRRRGDYLERWFERRHEELTTVRAVAATRRPTRNGTNQQEVRLKPLLLPSDRVQSRPVRKYGQVINELRGGLERTRTTELPIPPPPLRPGGSANTLHGI